MDSKRKKPMRRGFRDRFLYVDGMSAVHEEVAIANKICIEKFHPQSLFLAGTGSYINPMRFAGITLLAAIARPSEGSGVVSDLALLARSTGQLQAQVHDPKRVAAAVAASTSVAGTKLISASSHVTSPLTAAATVPVTPGMSSNIRIMLAILLVAIAGALGVASLHTARVFGFVTESKSGASVSASRSSETDPESLTRLLNAHSLNGYGSIFASRGLLGAPSSPGNEEKPSVIIQ